MTTESATRAATQKATLVKNPKTFCALTSVECMLRYAGLAVICLELASRDVASVALQGQDISGKQVETQNGKIFTGKKGIG